MAWLMEQAGIAEMQVGSAGGRGDRELAVDLIAEAGFPAAALRQTPFRMWNMGARGCHPGVAMPRATAGNYFSGALGRTNRTIPEDAARALADLVLACQPAGLDVVMRVGEAVEGAGGPGLPLCRISTLGSGGPPPAPGGTAVGGTILAPEVRRSRGGRAVQEPGSQPAADSPRTRAPGLGRMAIGDAAGLHMVLDGGPASEGPQGGGTAGDPSGGGLGRQATRTG